MFGYKPFSHENLIHFEMNADRVAKVLYLLDCMLLNILIFAKFGIIYSRNKIL